LHAGSGKPLQQHELVFGTALEVMHVVVTAQAHPETGMYEPVLVVHVDTSKPPTPMQWLPNESFR
jgi:hypothetical protein